MADVSVSEYEARFAIIVLLRDHPIESDCPRSDTSHAGSPDAQAEPTPAQIQPHDIETNKGEMLVVIHDRKNCSRYARKLAEHESVWRGGSEARTVSQSGVPALRVRPVHCKR